MFDYPARPRRPCAASILLIDARHRTQGRRREAMTLLTEAAVSYQMVLTKADKLKPAEVAEVTAPHAGALAKRPAAFPAVLATSAETGAGMPELRAEDGGAWRDSGLSRA